MSVVSIAGKTKQPFRNDGPRWGRWWCGDWMIENP